MSDRTRCGAWATLLAAAILFFAPTAGAHERPDGFYFGGGGGVEWFSLPSVEGIVDGTLNAVGQTDGTFVAESYELHFGYVDGSGLHLPDALGENARIEARVRYTNGESDSHVNTPLALGFFPINNPGLGANGGGGGMNRASYQTDLYAWDADLLFKTDVRFSDQLVFRPLVGVTYSNLKVKNDFTIFENGINQSLLFDLDDRVETHYLGIALGADMVVRPIDLLSFTLGIRSDLMGATAKLRAEQNFASGPPPVGENRESDHDTGFAARTTANVGLGLHLGMLTLSVDGFVRHHSYMAMPAHPTSSSHRTSHIDPRDAWSAGGMARLSIQLP